MLLVNIEYIIYRGRRQAFSHSFSHPAGYLLERFDIDIAIFYGSSFALEADFTGTCRAFGCHILQDAVYQDNNSVVLTDDIV